MQGGAWLLSAGIVRLRANWANVGHDLDVEYVGHVMGNHHCQLGCIRIRICQAHTSQCASEGGSREQLTLEGETLPSMWVALSHELEAWKE